MNTFAKLMSFGLGSLLVAACGATPSGEESREDTETTKESLSVPSGSISASPNPVYVAPGGLGTATINWTWSRGWTVYQYGCVYVQVDGGTPSVFDCEHPGNNYSPKATWLQAGHHYVFGIVPQYSPGQVNYSNPVPWIASTVVSVIAAPEQTCTNPCDKPLDDGIPVSCTTLPGQTCTVNANSVTCGGVTTSCGRNACPTCSTRQ